ncbi:hypothetical protein FKG94_16655 [Exilibacterium tricleocarpae]|uniref:Uncharacterized protein n=1 Tax=Exilibacterium tricleocarpae TaxID=2591008 RepID=A0A545TAJ3_9GAMM|nr:hypothetical protein [Exilibacterium tricleocarpae]TQV74236.1 hypothetical protein FKG94_16655 [Exilibacterium tricleocarpae]
MSNNPYETPRSEVGRSGTMTGDQRLTPGSLFKLLFIGFLFGLGPLLLANGIYDLVTGGESMVSLNESTLSGTSGFIGTLVFIPIMALIFSGITWVFVSIGTWVYSLFWRLNLQFKE